MRTEPALPSSELPARIETFPPTPLAPPYCCIPWPSPAGNQSTRLEMHKSRKKNIEMQSGNVMFMTGNSPVKATLPPLPPSKLTPDPAVRVTFPPIPLYEVELPESKRTLPPDYREKKQWWRRSWNKVSKCNTWISWWHQRTCTANVEAFNIILYCL